jgi:two-component system LytT family response regulator
MKHDVSTPRTRVNLEPRPARPTPHGTPASGILRLLVRHGGDLRFLGADDIEWLQADGRHTVIHAGVRRHAVRRALAEVEEQLDPGRFLRISRTAIVNLQRVSQLVPWFGGEYVVQLVSDARLKLTRPYADELFARLGRPL